MSEERRRKVILIGGILILLAILLLLFFPRKKAAAPTAIPESPPEIVLPTETEAGGTLPSVTNPLLPTIPAPVDERVAAVQAAESFAERYGSYSNQAKYENLTDLLPVMTAGFRAESEKMIAAAGTITAAPEYEGVTSRKISSKVGSYNAKAGRAEVTVTLQQTKTTARETVVSYRTILIKLVQGADKVWLVDSAAWGELVGS